MYFNALQVVTWKYEFLVFSKFSAETTENFRIFSKLGGHQEWLYLNQIY